MGETETERGREREREREALKMFDFCSSRKRARKTLSPPGLSFEKRRRQKENIDRK